MSLALGLASSAVVLLAWWGGAGIEGLEQVVGDRFLRMRGPAPPDPRVAVVSIDGDSVDRYGRWPWPRHLLARLVEALSRAEARTLAFDLVFSEPSRQDPICDLSFEDEDLAQAMEAAGNVMLGYFFRSTELPAGAFGPRLGAAAPALQAGESPELPPLQQVIYPAAGSYPIPVFPAVELNRPVFARAAAGQGFFNHEREQGVLRHYGLVAGYGGRYYPSLALRAVAHQLGARLALRPRAGVLPQVEIDGREVPVDEAGRLWVSYRGPAGTFETVPAWKLLEGEMEPDRLRGRLVFVGVTEEGVGDFVASPFGELPGVEVHANVAANLLAGDVLLDAGPQLATSMVALLSLPLVAAVLVGAPIRHGAASLVAVGMVFAWPVLTYLAFRHSGWHLQTVPPMLAGGLALISSLGFRVGFVEARARQIKRLFQRYVSRDVVEELLQHPEKVRLSGEDREMTVLFLDIRGFTALAEKASPEEVVRLLNDLFTPMTRLVLAEGGTLDKYMGDALMAFFGAPSSQPDHAVRACRAALAMRRELARLNTSWRATGRFPAAGTGLGVGIGLNSGEMRVGNMGSEEVFNYTVIGDNVNLGSRVEGLSRVYGVEALVTDATAVRAGEGFVYRELDRVRVKGRQEAVTLYELMAFAPGEEEDRRRMEGFARGLDFYRRQRFESAEVAFLETLERFPGDGPSRLFAERCQAYQREPPPPGWEAVESFAFK